MSALKLPAALLASLVVSNEYQAVRLSTTIARETILPGQTRPFDKSTIAGTWPLGLSLEAPLFTLCLSDGALSNRGARMMSAPSYALAVGLTLPKQTSCPCLSPAALLQLSCKHVFKLQLSIMRACRASS
jgi:hypothetical protein